MSQFTGENIVVQRLLQASRRLAALKRDEPGSGEVSRFEMIVGDLTGQLSPAQKVMFENAAAGLSEKEIRAKAAADLEAMEANRDRPSI